VINYPSHRISGTLPTTHLTTQYPGRKNLVIVTGHLLALLKIPISTLMYLSSTLKLYQGSFNDNNLFILMLLPNGEEGKSK
jgi:hypothetical protein